MSSSTGFVGERKSSLWFLKLQSLHLYRGDFLEASATPSMSQWLLSTPHFSSEICCPLFFINDLYPSGQARFVTQVFCICAADENLHGRQFPTGCQAATVLNSVKHRIQHMVPVLGLLTALSWRKLRAWAIEKEALCALVPS